MKVDKSNSDSLQNQNKDNSLNVVSKAYTTSPILPSFEEEYTKVNHKLNEIKLHLDNLLKDKSSQHDKNYIKSANNFTNSSTFHCEIDSLYFNLTFLQKILSLYKSSINTDTTERQKKHFKIGLLELYIFVFTNFLSLRKKYPEEEFQNFVDKQEEFRLLYNLTRFLEVDHIWVSKMGLLYFRFLNFYLLKIDENFRDKKYKTHNEFEYFAFKVSSLISNICCNS